MGGEDAEAGPNGAQRETGGTTASARQNGKASTAEQVEASSGETVTLDEVVVKREVDAGASQKKPRKCRAVLRFIKRRLVEYWFIIGVCVAIGVAAAYPKLGKNNGYVASQYSVKYGAVIVIFLLTGMALKTKTLAKALLNVRLHLLVQAISLGVIPAIGYGISKGLQTTSFNEFLAQGIVVVTSMPTTVSTNVVFTQQAGGNEPAAVVNSVLGNVLGIFITPALLRGYLGKTGQAPFAEVFKELAITVIAPLFAGQLLQMLVPKWIHWLQRHIKFSYISSFMIILLVWVSFCNTLAKPPKVNAASIVGVVFLDLGMFFGFSWMCFLLSWPLPFRKIYDFDRADVIAVVMCGATKTLALGVPMINAMYKDTPYSALLATPLIIYHALQVFFGSLIVRPVKWWNEREDRQQNNHVDSADSAGTKSRSVQDPTAENQSNGNVDNDTDTVEKGKPTNEH